MFKAAHRSAIAAGVGLALLAGTVSAPATFDPTLRLLSGGAQPPAWSTTLSMTTAAVSTAAGSGTSGVLDGSASGSRFATPSGMSIVGGYGYVIDSRYIRKLDLSTGAVTTVAGNGTASCTDSNTPSSAALGDSTKSTLTNDGTNLYWADTNCGTSSLGRLRYMSLSTGQVTTVPNAVQAAALTVGPAGGVYIGLSNQIKSVDVTTGSLTTVATLPSITSAGGTYPQSITSLAADGTQLWVAAESYNYPEIISSTSLSGTVNSLSTRSTATGISSGLVSAGNYLYLSTGTRVSRITKADGTLIDLGGASSGYLEGSGAEAWFGALAGIDTDGSNLWVTDAGNYRIRKLSATANLPTAQPSAWSTSIPAAVATISTVAGDGTRATTNGTGTAAEFLEPTGLSIYGGSAYVMDGTYLRRIDLSTGAVTNFAGNGTSAGTGVRCVDSANPSAAAVSDAFAGMTNDGKFLYWLDVGCGLGSGNGILRRTSLTTGATSTVQPNVYGSSITTGPGGAIYLAQGNTVYRVDPASGAKTLIGTVPTSIWGLAADSSYLYVSARPNDGAARIYTLDAATGVVSALTAYDSTVQLGGALVSAGNYLYVAGNNHINIVSKASGAFTSIAGNGTGYAEGTGSAAKFNYILGYRAGIDTDGTNVYLADFANYRVRKLSVAVPISALPYGITPTYPNSGLGGYEITGPGNVSENCSCGQGQATSNPVNTATGSFWHTFTDLATPGRGLGLQISRTYTSALAAQDSQFGYGWSSSYGLNLTRDSSGTVTVHQEDGSAISFATPGDGTYTPLQPRMLASLVQHSDGTYTMVRKKRTIFTFNDVGRLISLGDLNGETTTLAYDAAGKLTSVADPSGRSYTLTVAGGHITQITDPASRSYAYAYSSAGDLVSVTDPTGAIWAFTYDSSHRLLTMLDPNQHGSSTPTPVTNVYDSSGRVTSQTDYAGRVTTLDYTAISGATKITDPAGYVTVDYFTNGQRTSSTVGYGTASAATTAFTYDATTRAIATVTDPLSHTTTFTYDARGNELSVTDPLSHVTTNTYDSLNDQLTSTDPNGVTTTNSYDSRGNLLTSSTPLLSATGSTLATRTTIYAHSTSAHPGDLTAVTNPNGNTTTFSYDSYGDLTTVTAPPSPENASGDRTTYTYNTDTGWRTSMVSPRGNLPGATAAAYTTTYGYDQNGLPSLTRDSLWSPTAPTQHQTSTTYDLDGNVASVSDGNGRVTSYVRDADGEVITTNLPNGLATHQTWTANGQLATVTDTLSRVTTYTYNSVDELITSKDPLNNITSYGYDLAGRRTLITAPGATCTGTPTAGCTSTTYNAANQVTAVSYLDGATAGISSVTYDADGHRTGQTDASGTSSYTFDSLGRLTSSTDGNGVNTSYGFDLGGNLISLSYPGNHTVTRTYDSLDRVASVTDWLSNTVTFGYDADSDPTRTVFPASTAETDRIDYDQTGAATSLTDERTVSGTTTTLASFSYTRDGNRDIVASTTTGVVEPAQSYPRGYLRQVNASGPSSSPTTYSYDDTNNLTNRGTTAGGAASTQTFNPDDQLCWSTAVTVLSPTCASVPTGATTYAYDTNGNRTTRTPSSGPATTYGYDEAQQLRTYTAPSGAVTSYTYDSSGLRQSKTGSGTTTHFTWDLADSLPLLLSDDSNYYIYDNDNAPLEQISSSGTVTWLHHDQLESTRLLTDNTGSAVGTATYDPWGTLTATTGTASSSLGFNGQYSDSESGLIYLRARYYDPATAQFLSRDPLVAITRAAYAYAGANPINESDPTGLCCSIDGALRTVNKFNPMRPMVEGFVREYQAYSSGCGFVQSVAIGIQGTLVSAGNIALLEAGGEGVLGVRAAVKAASAARGADQAALDFATRPSKLDHLFAAKHNFDPLVQQFGSREAVVQQMLIALKGLTPLSGLFEEQVVVGGQKVVVRGAVVDGIVKIGTAFTPP